MVVAIQPHPRSISPVSFHRHRSDVAFACRGSTGGMPHAHGARAQRARTVGASVAFPPFGLTPGELECSPDHFSVPSSQPHEQPQERFLVCHKARDNTF